MANDLPGADQVQNANSQGQSALNNFDPTSVANSQNQGFNSLFNSQTGSGPKNATDYMGAYANTVASNPSVTSLYNKANTMFNVPNLQNQATYLNNQVTNQLPMQQQMMRGFDASQNQIDNATNYNLRFLQPQATAATANANTASNLASNYVQAGQAQNAQNLLPIQSYGPMLQQTMAAQATGWTQDAQNQFAGLQAKMEQGVALSQTEMAQLAQLQSAKEQYDASMAASQAGITEAQLGNQYKILPQGNNLVNTSSKSILNPSMLTAGTGAARYG